MIDKIVKEYKKSEEQVKREVHVRDKAVEILSNGATFCENDSQGIYDKCNIAINRDKKAIKILKGEDK